MRITAIGDPFLIGDTLTFILNKTAKTTLSFTAESVRNITPSNLQDNNEGTLETMAAVLGEARESHETDDGTTLEAAKVYADGQDAIQTEQLKEFTTDEINSRLANTQGPQGKYDVSLYSRVAQGDPAFPTPTNIGFDGNDFTNVPNGWQSEFFGTLDEENFDYYESFATYDPSTGTLSDWATPFLLGADAGPTGPAGPVGPRGPAGTDGRDGRDGSDWRYMDPILANLRQVIDDAYISD